METSDGEVTLDAALPALWASCEAELAPSAGEATCKPGCTACCEHLVPLAPAEARRLRAAIAALPPDEQVTVRRRFTAAKIRLGVAGLWDLLRETAAAPEEGRLWLASAYRDLALPCPLLDDDGRCRVYADRPLACRLQLVTSDPAECHKPRGGRVVPLRVRGRPPVRAIAALEGADWSPLACLFATDMPPEPPATPRHPPGEWRRRFDALRK